MRRLSNIYADIHEDSYHLMNVRLPRTINSITLLILKNQHQTIQLRHAYGRRVGPGITVRNGHITFLATFDAQSVLLGRRWNPLMGLVWRLQCS